MKTLNQMDETEFLRRCWLIADAVSELLTKTKVMELRKVMPVFQRQRDRRGKEAEEGRAEPKKPQSNGKKPAL